MHCYLANWFWFGASRIQNSGNLRQICVHGVVCQRRRALVTDERCLARRQLVSRAAATAIERRESLCHKVTYAEEAWDATPHAFRNLWTVDGEAAKCSVLMAAGLTSAEHNAAIARCAATIIQSSANCPNLRLPASAATSSTATTTAALMR